MIAKPISIKDAKRKFGGCTQKAVELTSGDLFRVAKSRLRVMRVIRIAEQKSAEGEVLTQVGKARTVLRQGGKGSGE
jgi:hypothetical protein